VTRTIEIEPSGVANGSLVAEVMAAVGDESIGFHEIADLLTRDSALATEVMRVANSRYYGLAGVVESLQFACAVVGSLGLRAIALAELGRRGGRYPQELNVAAQAIATRAGAIAEQEGLDPLVAVAAGLVVNLGSMLIAQQDPVGFAATQCMTPEDCAEFEREHYGETALAITVRALQRWSFPEDFIIGVQQRPDHPLGSILARAIEEVAKQPDDDPADDDHRRCTC
jgi:HD-like signal output (HDOD) protein